MHALDGKLYFQGKGDDDERELYVYDPEAGTTTKVTSADINSGGSTDPSFMHALDGKLYFNGSDGSELELYVYDPDTNTTVKVDSADIEISAPGRKPLLDMHALDGKLYFQAYNGGET